MKQVLILGATSGISKALAYHFASKKVDLILAGRDMEELGRLASDLEIRYEIHAKTINFDALKEENTFFERCIQLAGDLDGMIVSYGLMYDQKEMERNGSLIREMTDINYTSTIILLEEAARYFEKKQKGCICAISSVAGDRGRRSNYIYGASKGALTVYLQGLRNRLANSKVNVLTVKPGFVDTKMTYGLIKPTILVASPAKVAASIYQSILKKKEILYTPWYWFYIMKIIRLIPEKLFKRMKW
ncbi:SDR family oxidoreductase [Ectobacillus polymachus]|uniref:SDR family oxidoreductase n=1 Tax=Ectobacillus polymachus TaxID=1508806 RepID=UPI003A893B3B